MAGHTLVNLVVAVVTAELFHATSEVWSARFKLGCLRAWQRGEDAPTLPINVDTQAKAYAVLATVAIVLVGASFGVATAVDPSTRAAVIYSVVVVACTYAIGGLGFDRFHSEVSQLGAAIRASNAQRPRSE